MASYRTYEEAHSAACTLARLLKRDAGIEKLKTYEGVCWIVRSLPKPENRYGVDARCQVVTRDEPRMAGDPNLVA